MIKPIILNDNHVDIEKVSFIGKIDTKVFAHIGRRIYFFTIIVDGLDVDIEADQKKEIKELRNTLIFKCNPDYSEP
jgi:hypothetical protein